jgi:hypothetical protein
MSFTATLAFLHCIDSRLEFIEETFDPSWLGFCGRIVPVRAPCVFATAEGHKIDELARFEYELAGVKPPWGSRANLLDGQVGSPALEVGYHALDLGRYLVVASVDCLFFKRVIGAHAGVVVVVGRPSGRGSSLLTMLMGIVIGIPIWWFLISATSMCRPGC